VQLIEGLNVADRFRLVRELGRGGMGSVWLAEHTRLDALCAVKFIDREGRNNWEVRRRFHHEAKAAAQLRSPHVVQILDHGEWESIPYIAMEYLEGEDLAHRLHRVGRLSWGETCRIASQVARALGKAHAAGIVHRDVKPENIFLVRDDDSEIAKVLDFGIAQHATSEPNGSNRSILGTPFYMSPEQASGSARLDHRSDLFSLAVIVYQCLTGELPFIGNGVMDVFAQILRASLPVPSQKAADLPPTFDAWWARAAARDVSSRYQTAKEFAEALNVSLRISEVLEIASLMPRAEIGSSGRISLVAGSLSSLASHAQFASGPTLAIHTTLDESYSRTFEPESPFRKRRLPLFASIGAAAILAVGLLFARGESAAPRVIEPRNATHAAAATSDTAAPVSATAPNLPPPLAAAPVVERAAAKLPSSSVTPSSRVRATAKGDGPRSTTQRHARPAKPAAVVRTADDFGI
jgi:serine/threonine protein kinase